MSKIYLTTQTLENFKWPRLIPLTEKPSQPPVKTGVRIYCPEPDSSICKDGYDDSYNRKSQSRSKKSDKEDDCVLMSREKFILLNKHLINRYHKHNDGLKSNYQICYTRNPVTYDKLIEQSNKTSKDQLKRRKCEIDSSFVDPLNLKRTVEKGPILPLKYTFVYS